ncbi:MAG: hypothetical protein IPL61_38675 [Myxococcales bacterium]|nr:hypothetical protein [Myxococcales bacterium]
MRTFGCLLVLAAACGGPSRGGTIANHGGAGPTGPAPTIAWSGGPPGEGGSFTATGLPAIAAGGDEVLVADIGEDGARGMPNLALVARGRDDRERARRVVLTADAAEAQDPDQPMAAPDVAGANAWLAEQHQRAAWTPLVAAAITANDESALAAERWAATSGDVALTFDDSGHVVITVAGAAVVDRLMTAWLAPDAPMYPGAGPDEQCYNPIALAAAYLDGAHKLALVRVTFRGNDSCWEPDGAYHVVAW